MRKSPLYRSMKDPFLGNLERRNIRLSIPVYAINNAIVTTYSFNSNSSQATGTFGSSLSTLIAASPEFLAQYNQFGLMRIIGAELAVNNTINMVGVSNVFTSYPSIAFSIVPTYNTLQTYSAFQADTNMIVNLNNTNKITKKYYPFNGVMQSSSGYPICGSGCWFYPGGYSTNNALYVILGFGTAPTVSSSVTTGVLICNIDVDVVVDFACPCRVL